MYPQRLEYEIDIDKMPEPDELIARAKANYDRQNKTLRGLMERQGAALHAQADCFGKIMRLAEACHACEIPLGLMDDTAEYAQEEYQKGNFIASGHNHAGLIPSKDPEHPFLGVGVMGDEMSIFVGANGRPSIDSKDKEHFYESNLDMASAVDYGRLIEYESENLLFWLRYHVTIALKHSGERFATH